MSEDTTWRDVYGDAEGLAETMDDWARLRARIGNYKAATDCAHAATALRDQAERIAELEAENARLTAIIDNAPLDELHGCDCCGATTTDAEEVDGGIQCRACGLEYEVKGLSADLQGAEQRVLSGFASYCDSQAMLCKYGQTAVEWAQRAEIVRDYARQRAQAEGSDSSGETINQAGQDFARRYDALRERAKQRRQRPRRRKRAQAEGSDQ